MGNSSNSLGFNFLRALLDIQVEEGLFDAESRDNLAFMYGFTAWRCVNLDRSLFPLVCKIISSDMVRVRPPQGFERTLFQVVEMFLEST